MWRVKINKIKRGVKTSCFKGENTRVRAFLKPANGVFGCRKRICRMRFSAFWGCCDTCEAPTVAAMLQPLHFLSVLPPLRKLLILIDCCVMCRCRSSKRAAFRPTLCHSTAATSHALRYFGTMVLWSGFWVLRGAAAVQADQKSMSCPGEAAAQPTGLALIKHLSTAKK